MIKLQPTGTFHKQYVRCGKPNCKCAKGEPHGPYWYYFRRDYFAAFDEEKRRRVYKNRLAKVYIPKDLLEEAIKQDREWRVWPKLTLSLTRHLKTNHVKPLAKILENAYRNQNTETARWAEEEFKKLWPFLQVINNNVEEANPVESGKLDSAQIELGKLMTLVVFTFWTKQSTGKFEYGLPRL